MIRALLILATLGLQPLSSLALCTSDDVPQPQAVLERFISADCEDCWRDPATPRPAPGQLALDWVLPGSQGEAAPLSVVASTDAEERVLFLGRKPPARSDSASGARAGEPLRLRLAQGEAFNDYIGTSIELPNRGRERWQAWLLLVEQVPAGTEGSPVERNLVRNAFRPDWAGAAARPPAKLAETRAMQIREGARAERLRLVAVVHDQRGRIRGISRTECRE